MEKKYAVSVIVPVYNVEKYIKECLDSLVNQTLQNIEIIVVNDGSPDNSQKIIDEYAKKYPQKIKSYIKKNGGISDARNYGISKANGEYIGFVDSDDFVDKTMYEKMYNFAKESNCNIVACNLIKFLENSNKYVFNGFIKKNQIINVENNEEIKLLTGCRAFVWNKIFKKEIFDNFIFPVGQIFEDSAIVYNILFSTKKIFITNESLYYYRINREGAITSTVNEKIFDIFKSCDNIIKYHKQNNTFEKFYEIIEEICLIHIFRRITLFSLTKNNKLKRKYINKAYSYLDYNFPNWKKSEMFKNNKKIKYKVFKSKKLITSYVCSPNLLKKILRYFVKLLRKVKRLLRIGLFGKKRKYNIEKQRLRELQLIELDIFKEIDRICKNNNLKYYLIEGSLLGAVRHKGFIPWDDDFDIGMFREDYEKFLDIADGQLDIGYKLCCYKNIKNYHLPFSKVVTLNNRGFFNTESMSLKRYNGPYVDIFPLDTSSFSMGKYQYKKFKKIRKYRDILLLKIHYRIKFSWKRLLYFVESPFYSYKRLHKKIYKLSTKDANKEANFIVNYASSYGLPKEIFPSCTFNDGVCFDFEGIKIRVPKNYNYILTRVYGDYMTPPPLKKRMSKHSICDKTQNLEKGDICE